MRFLSIFPTLFLAQYSMSITQIWCQVKFLYFFSSTYHTLYDHFLGIHPSFSSFWDTVNASISFALANSYLGRIAWATSSNIPFPVLYKCHAVSFYNSRKFSNCGEKSNLSPSRSSSDIGTGHVVREAKQSGWEEWVGSTEVWIWSLVGVHVMLGIQIFLKVPPEAKNREWNIAIKLGT